MNTKKIAIVCDWLIDFGGAELVISHLLEAFPEADIYTSVCFMDHPMLEGRRVYTSWIQKIPFLGRRHKLAGILRPWAFRCFDLSGYDVVICSSSAESKQVAMGVWWKSFTEGQNNKEIEKQRKDVRETVKLGNCETSRPLVVVYCHTPTRYYWSHAKEYEDMMEFGCMNPLVKGVFRLVKGWMQKVDYEAAQKVDYFIANSMNTQGRIKKYYKRESVVIYPGVSMTELQYDRITVGQNTGSVEGENSDCIDGKKGEICETVKLGNCETPFYLAVGRCIPYKKFDLLVDAFNINGKPLIIVTNTDNTLYHELKKKSRSNIIWKLHISGEERDTLYASARAFLFPPEEDFGLVPIEAMNFGTPVIAYEKGGALETVVDGVTGIFFEKQEVLALNTAIEKFETMTFDKEKIIEHATKFSKVKFQEKLINYINNI